MQSNIDQVSYTPIFIPVLGKSSFIPLDSLMITTIGYILICFGLVWWDTGGGSRGYGSIKLPLGDFHRSDGEQNPSTNQRGVVQNHCTGLLSSHIIGDI